MIWLNEHKARMGERESGPPDLAVEIISPSNEPHDTDTKVREYAQAAIPEYWIIELQTRSVSVYTLKGPGLTVRVGSAKMAWMKQNETLAAPRTNASPAAVSKWEREHSAFLKQYAALLNKHEGKYVAIHRGKVVGSGTDKVALGVRLYSKFGYVPIYVGFVSSQPVDPVRIPSPRRYDQGHQ